MNTAQITATLQIITALIQICTVVYMIYREIKISRSDKDDKILKTNT